MEPADEGIYMFDLGDSKQTNYEGTAEVDGLSRTVVFPESALEV
jgi:hypothetical protein